jgi:hypothetical protein
MCLGFRVRGLGFMSVGEHSIKGLGFIYGRKKLFRGWNHYVVREKGFIMTLWSFFSIVFL